MDSKLMLDIHRKIGSNISYLNSEADEYEKAVRQAFIEMEQKLSSIRVDYQDEWLSDIAQGIISELNNPDVRVDFSYKTKLVINIYNGDNWRMSDSMNEDSVINSYIQKINHLVSFTIKDISKEQYRFIENELYQSSLSIRLTIDIKKKELKAFPEEFKTNIEKMLRTRNANLI
jgi:hypothetical protein